jgi:D-serine deaminase-like pyridoxal phosphate-dependent protein
LLGETSTRWREEPEAVHPLETEFTVKWEQIKTPALVVDLDAMESNLESMAAFFRDKPCKLRPHFKNHKSPLLARRQIRAGAIGMTCATIREAEILVDHGIDNILIANEICGDSKAAALAALSRHATVIAAVDSRAGVCDFARAQRNRSTQIQVVPDIDIGLNRCGVQDAGAALELAEYARLHGLRVRGVMGYDGHLQAIPKGPERDQVVRQGSRMLVDAAGLLENAGMPVDVVSTGGTGTYSVSGQYPGVTDIQAGSYLLMDTIYMNRGAPFQRSLTVLATVISTRGSDHAVLDCGVKAISGERGLPSVVKDLPGAQLKALHAEHALIAIDPGSGTKLEAGQKVEVWVHYSDATVNLHSCFYGVRNGEVEEVYRIEH